MGEKPTDADEAAAREVSGIGSTSERTGGSMNAIQNMKGRTAAPGGGSDPTPAEATNLNSSRSNIYREAAPGDDDPEPSDSAVKSSKSNTSD